MNADRMVPHSQEAEEAVLGSVMLNPPAYHDVAEFLRAGDFFIVRNGWIWEAIARIVTRGDESDYLTVTEELRQQERLEEIGGAAYLTHLVNKTPSGIYAETYGHVVVRASLRRQMLAAASEIAQLAHEESADINQVINQSEAALFNVTARRAERASITLSASLLDVARGIDARSKPGAQKLSGIPTGFSGLDALLGGLQKSDLIYVAGRPGMGKTAWLLNVALYAARAGAKVGIFSMEMSHEQITQRLVAQDTGLSTQHLRTGQLDDQQYGLFYAAMERLSPLPIYIDDTPNLTPLSLRARCRRWHRERGLDLVIVDYVGLMASGLSRAENRTNEVSYISQQLKVLARELNVPVLVASQLSRGVDQRQDKRPVLSDLRDSGSLEQDADVVMFIYREEVYNENTERPNQADIIIAKHRNGPTGTDTLYFRRDITKFSNLHREEISFVGYGATDYKDTKRAAEPVATKRPANGRAAEPVDPPPLLLGGEG